MGYSFISRGRAGLERSRNGALTGQESEFGTIFSELQNRDREGRDVVTTLDPDGQRAALKCAGGRNGSIVAIEPQTGRVRVMVSVPEYDPNDVPERLLGVQPLAGRAAGQPRHPVGLSARVHLQGGDGRRGAGQRQVQRPSRSSTAPSPRTVSGVPLANAGGENFGPITLTDALTNSVNTVWAQVGESLGPRARSRSTWTASASTSDPPLDYPDGQMQPSGVRNSKGRLLDANAGFDVGRVAIGQGGDEGTILVTPLQMAMVAAAVGNRGELMRPRLTERIVAKDGRVTDRFRPTRQSRVMSESSARQLAQMMGNVVEEGTGTAVCAVGRQGGRQDRHRGGGQRHGQPGVVHRLRAAGPAEDGGGRDHRAHPGPGRHGCGAAGQAGASRRCWVPGGALSDRGGRQQGRRRAVQDRRADRLGRHGRRLPGRGHAPGQARSR
ncbi:MAG: penicillin-binding transpeptidase domain-containing protein [Thermoleophilaceae bacterium]